MRGRTLRLSLNLCLCLSLAWLVLIGLFRFLDHDELEHLHTAWLVFQGFEPYTDFFQHHHPLLWYLIWPLAALESPAALIWTRGLMLASALVILYLTYRLGRDLLGPFSARLAVLFLASLNLYTQKVIELRPDVPMTVMLLLAGLFLFRLLERPSLARSVGLGLSGGLAFFFLQKAVLGLGLMALILAVEAARRRLELRHLAASLAAFVAVLLPYAVYLTATGQLQVYYLLNWRLNFNWLFLFPARWVIRESLQENPLFYLFAAAGGIWLLSRRPRARLLPVLALGLYLGVALVPMCFRQYFLPALPFAALAAGAGAAVAVKGLRARRFAWLLPVLLLLAAPLEPTAREALTGTQAGQRAKAAYVLSVTGPGDLVYDGDIQFNLFRRDLDYFWYSLDPQAGLDSLQRLKPYDYDPYRLIEEKKPRLISLFGLAADHPVLRAYRPSPVHPDLLLRQGD